MRIRIGARGDSQKAILNYLEANASDVLVAKINSGAKSMDDCWNFIVECARKELNGKNGAILDAVVFGWAVHFFEEDSIKPEPLKKEYINQTMPNGQVKRVEAKKKEVPKKEPVKKEKEEDNWLEKAQISIFDLAGGQNDN